MTMKFKEFCHRMQYTWKHKTAFLKIEHELLGHNTLSGYLHYLDKILLWYPVAFISQKGIKWCHRQHRRFSKHHVENKSKKTRKDYINMIIDWECARYTKPDKPLNAYETMQKFYPELQHVIMPLLEEFRLNKYDTGR